MAAKHHQGFSLGGWLSDTIKSCQIDLNFAVGSDSYWMAHALRLSMSQVGKPNPNPAVGCVFVKNNQIVAQGATMEFGGLHAERKAIADCADPKVLRGSDCFVTLEPCTHYGKQPPCVEALAGLGIRRCIVALRDPFAVVNGRGIEYLRRKGIHVELGVLASEVAAWHFPFLLATKRQAPVVIGKWAQTLDGHMADDQGQSKWITGPLARQHTHWLRQKYDAIAIGGPTALMDQPSLDVRDCPPPINRHPTKMVFDPKARLLAANPLQSQELSNKLLQGEIVFWGVQAGVWDKLQQNQRNLADQLLLNGRLILVKLPDENVSFQVFLEAVNQEYPKHYQGRSLQSVMVEGGPGLLSSLVHAGTLDAAHVFINPSLIGGQKHRIGPLQASSHGGPTQAKAIDQRLHMIPLHLQALGPDLLWDLIDPKAYDLVWGQI